MMREVYMISPPVLITLAPKLQWEKFLPSRHLKQCKENIKNSEQLNWKHLSLCMDLSQLSQLSVFPSKPKTLLCKSFFPNPHAEGQTCLVWKSELSNARELRSFGDLWRAGWNITDFFFPWIFWGILVQHHTWASRLWGVKFRGGKNPHETL